MGAVASKVTAREFSQLSRDQVEKTEKQLANVTKGNSLDRTQFEKIYDKLQPAVAAIFAVIEEKNKCTFSNVLRLADELFADASRQSAALLKIFGSVEQALAGVISIYARRNHLSATESAAMLDYLMLEVPTDESRFERWLVRNTVAGSLILNVFSPLIFEEGFHMGPLYHGDATSFLFEVKPHIRIYSATGHTQNYAYLNCQQVSLPNGLGIGGYENVWPFFLHEEYGKGITLANISSFEKCYLSGSDQFMIEYGSELQIKLEVWRVGEKPRVPLQEEEVVRSEKSVIDKDPEAKAILEMTGRRMHSEAYREPAPLLDDDTLIKPKRQ